MQLGIFAKTFAGGSPEVVLGAAARAGFGSVQYNMACSGIGALPEQVADAVALAVRQASVAAGVRIAGLSATYNMIHPDVAQRAAGRRSFAALAAQAGAMGTRLLTVCTGSADAADQWRHHPDNGSREAWAAMMAEFGHLVPIADRHDVVIGVEPEMANVVDSAASARRLLDSVGSDRVRIVLDPANLAEGVAPEERRFIIGAAVDLLADRLVMAHAKDRSTDDSFATAGTGVIDFPHFVACLRAAGFDGPLIAHGLAEDEAAGVAAYLSGLLR